jgi:hypothetical protein
VSLIERALRSKQWQFCEKFHRYQVWNPTLTDYLLVSQTAPIIEHYSRQSDGGWSYKIYQGLDRSVTIESIGCELRLADIYDRINFESKGSDASVEDPG